MVAGVQEVMSGAQHCMNLRNPTKMGDGKMVDTMLLDGLMDAFNNYHMGMYVDWANETVVVEVEVTQTLQPSERRDIGQLVLVSQCVRALGRLHGLV